MNYTNKLTKTEEMIAIKICQQKTNKLIASELGVGRRTVESHRSRIMQKVRAESLVGIVLYAVKNKIYEI